MTNSLDEKLLADANIQGRTIILSFGSYSDYGLQGIVEWISTTSLSDAFFKWKEEAAPSKYWEPSGFITWLIKNNYAIEHECLEMNLEDLELDKNATRPSSYRVLKQDS